MLKKTIGHYPVASLEKPGPAEDVRAGCQDLATSTCNRYLSELRFITNWALGRDDLQKTPFHKFGVRISTKDEVQRNRRVSEEEEASLLAACDELERRRPGARRLTWEQVRGIRQRVAAGEQQKAIADEYELSSGMVSDIVNDRIWREDDVPVLTCGREMRDRIVGAIETCCRKGELLGIQNKHVDWQNGYIEIPKEHAKGKKARSIPFRGNDRLTKILERRRFLGSEAYVFGDWNSGEPIADFRRAWESVLLMAHAVKPVYKGRRQKLTAACTARIAEINLHFHDLRHEGLSRYGEGGMLLRELQMLAGHANPQTTTRYEHVEMERLSDAMQRAKRRREQRKEQMAAQSA